MALNQYEIHGVVIAAVAGRFNGSGAAAGAVRSVTTWVIQAGEIAGVTVDGSVLVSIRQQVEASESDERLLLVEEDLGPEVVRWLVDAFQGRLGGPLAGIAGAPVVERGFFQVPIRYRVDPSRVSVEVPGRLTVAASGRGISAQHPDAPQGGWTADWLGEAVGLAVAIPEHRMAWSHPVSEVLKGEFTFATDQEKLVSRRQRS